MLCNKTVKLQKDLLLILNLKSFWQLPNATSSYEATPDQYKGAASLA